MENDTGNPTSSETIETALREEVRHLTIAFQHAQGEERARELRPLLRAEAALNLHIGYLFAAIDGVGREVVLGISREYPPSYEDLYLCPIDGDDARVNVMYQYPSARCSIKLAVGQEIELHVVDNRERVDKTFTVRLFAKADKAAAEEWVRQRRQAKDADLERRLAAARQSC